MYDLNLLLSTEFESMASALASALAPQCSTKYIKYSTNWPAPNVCIFMAQLVEHCRTNAAAMVLNPFNALELFSRLNSKLPQAYTTTIVTSSLKKYESHIQQGFDILVTIITLPSWSKVR